ncbi:MAG: CHASE2 domain-containing protein [Holophagales bacterium]|nr:CHASE2 domain-containing protein [Holophagales bacterium]
MLPRLRVRPAAFEAAVPVAAFLAVSLALATGLPAALDLPVRDALLRALPSRPVTDVAVVAIDEGALATEGAWPWPRARLAAVAGAVRTAGARVLAIDILLVAPGEGDDALAARLGEMPSVLAAGLDAKAGWLLPAPSLRGAGRLAETSFDVDHDGVMRRLSATKQRDGFSLPALSVAAVSLANGPARPVPVGRVLVPDFRRRPAGVPLVGAADLLAGRSVGRLRGRVVFLGVTAAGLGDRFVTPGSPSATPEPGVLVHAATASCLLAGGLLRPVPPYASGLLAAAFAGLALLAGRGRGPAPAPPARRPRARAARSRCAAPGGGGRAAGRNAHRRHAPRDPRDRGARGVARREGRGPRRSPEGRGGGGAARRRPRDEDAPHRRPRPHAAPFPASTSRRPSARASWRWWARRPSGSEG